MFLQLAISWVAQVNRLPNLQHKIHLDNKLDKVLEKLQAQEPNVEGIKQKLEHWSAWVRYCQGNPKYIFKEFKAPRRVEAIAMPGGQFVYQQQPADQHQQQQPRRNGE